MLYVLCLISSNILPLPLVCVVAMRSGIATVFISVFASLSDIFLRISWWLL